VESALFQHAGRHGVKLIETLGWDGHRLPRLDLHLARLAAGAAALGYACDIAQARRILVEAGQDAGQHARARLRLTLDADGNFDLTCSPMPPAKLLWRVCVSPHRLDTSDPYLRIKSTHRRAYDAARAALPAGFDEVILLNQRGEVADGSISTVFFDRGAGLRTPPLSCGALPGVLRASLAYPEEVILPQELLDIPIWIGNSLRGLIPAQFEYL